MSHGPYELFFEDRKGYLFACVTAPTTSASMALAYLTEIANRCKADAVKCLMIRRDIPGTLKVTNVFGIANEFLKMLPKTRVAFVNPYEDNRNAKSFGMTVGQNRGEFHRLFTNEIEAEKWLLAV